MITVCDGRRMLALLVVAAVASDPSVGVPGFDPHLEQVVLTKPLSGVPTMRLARGSYSAGDDGLTLTSFAPWGETEFLLPAVVDNGVVRVRVVVGAALDAAVVVRAHADPGDDVEVDGGYGVSLENNKVRLVRWEHRIARFLGVESKLEPAPKPGEALEIVVVAAGPWLQATVFRGDSFARLAHVAVLDRGFGSGHVGVRYGRADKGTVVSFISVGGVGPASDANDLGDDGDVGGAGVDRVVVVAEADVGRLPQDLQKKIAVTEDGRAFVVTDPVGVERVRRSGVTIEQHKTQIPWRLVDAGLRARLGKPPTKTSAGFRVDESYKDDAMVNNLINAYAQRFPMITKVVEIGRSGENRPILALVLGKNVNSDDSKPSVLLDGSHHGGELLAVEFVLDALQQLVERYGKDKDVTHVLDTVNVWCVPLVNVDGNHRYIWSTRDYDRKNARDVDDNGRVDGWDGVDLYRNYPVAWGGLGEVGSRSWRFHYRWRGPSAGSEPEIQAMMALAAREHFVASIDYHTNATKILVPYTDPSMINPDVNEAWSIADEIAATLPIQINKKSYEVVRNLYPVDGTAQDYFRFMHGTVALLVEGPQNNPLPYDKTRNGNVVPGRGIWQGLLRRVVDGPSIKGHVVDDGGRAVEAEVIVREQAPRQGERWTSRPRDGFYQRLVAAPGHYTVVVKAAGKADVVRGVDVGDGPVVVNVTVR